jgi:acyl-CoA thioesterase I
LRQWTIFILHGLGLFSFINAQIKIACIGNSITEGYGLAKASTQSYPARLSVLLGTGYTVQNDGASGRTMLKSDTKNSYWKFGKLSQALALKPNIVTIELGTNDANNFASSWNTTGVEFKSDYLAMIDTLNSLSPKPRIFVIQPLPIRGNNDATLVKANAIIKQVALERGLTLVDCYTPFSGQAQLYADGLHPNAAGADTMAHIIYRAIIKPTVAVLKNQLMAATLSLLPDFEGSSFASISKVISEGGRFRIKVFNSRGSFITSADIIDGSPLLISIHMRLRSSPGMHWISLERLTKHLGPDLK